MFAVFNHVIVNFSAMIKKYNIMESDKLSRFCDESDHCKLF